MAFRLSHGADLRCEARSADRVRHPAEPAADLQQAQELRPSCAHDLSGKGSKTGRHRHKGKSMPRTRVEAQYTANRQRILDEAAHLFAAKGFPRTTIVELATACQCSKALLYHYFASKED